MQKLIYKAAPGRIRLDPSEDTLTNYEPVSISIEGHAIPSHIDGDGHPVGSGFDIIALSLNQPADFVSSHAVVHLDIGQQLHWRQCPEALQWADEQVRY